LVFGTDGRTNEDLFRQRPTDPVVGDGPRTTEPFFVALQRTGTATQNPQNMRVASDRNEAEFAPLKDLTVSTVESEMKR